MCDVFKYTVDLSLGIRGCLQHSTDYESSASADQSSGARVRESDIIQTRIQTTLKKADNTRDFRTWHFIPNALILLQTSRASCISTTYASAEAGTSSKSLSSLSFNFPVARAHCCTRASILLLSAYIHGISYSNIKLSTTQTF